jgi:cobalt-zinc-cadmium efflux system membrane fusion protein
MRPGQSLSVHVPAVGAAAFKATVDFVGREISPETNAIPIVATIDNSEGRLRPGLFARVDVPLGATSKVLTVPASAVLHHEGRSFVFVPQSSHEFRRVDVRPGAADAERVEITSGLQDGDRVVTEGAFILKSELLLESTEE